MYVCMVVSLFRLSPLGSAQHGQGHEAHSAGHAVAVHVQLVKRLVPLLPYIHTVVMEYF